MTKEPKTQAHTEGWKVSLEAVSHTREIEIVNMASGKIVAVVNLIHYRDHSEAVVNAHKIVRDHNSHKELVEIAKDTLKFLLANNNGSPAVSQGIRDIEQALKKAEEL